jgi:hypothetical protein
MAAIIYLPHSEKRRARHFPRQHKQAAVRKEDEPP